MSVASRPPERGRTSSGRGAAQLIGLAVLVVALAGVASAETDPYTISLLTGTWTPAPGVSAASVQSLKALAVVSGRETIHVLVQFHEHPTAQEREALSSAGLRLGSYATGRAWVAAVPAGQLEALASRPDVRYLTAWDSRFKLHPRLRAGRYSSWALDAARPDWVMTFVVLHEDVPLDAASAVAAAVGGVAAPPVQGLHGFTLWLPQVRVPTLAQLEDVLWAEEGPPPLEPNNNGVREAMNADPVIAAPYQLTGSGVRLFVYDGGRVLDDHVTFVPATGAGSRVTTLDSSPISAHATHVAGTAAGDGSEDKTGPEGHARGVAVGAEVLSAGYEALETEVPEFRDYAGDIQADYKLARESHQADLANNSIGLNLAKKVAKDPEHYDCAFEGDYGVASALVDGIVRGDNSSVGSAVLMTWSAGNERGPGSCGSSYATTPPPSCAKNPIQVGAVASDGGAMTSFSSWGPCDDGRLAPLITAPGAQMRGDYGVYSSGCDRDPNDTEKDVCSVGTTNTHYEVMAGTSQAAPAVAGVIALLIQDWRSQGRGDSNERPMPALVKAMLAHTARDQGNAGPDYIYGYGLIDAKALIDLERSGNGELSDGSNWGTESVDHADEESWTFRIPAGSSEFKVTLAWDDPAAPLYTAGLVVNDLDLSLVSPTGVEHHAWVLDRANPQAPATHGRNDLDNLEQVLVVDPEAGEWTVRVLGQDVPQGPQAYGLVCTSKPGTGVSSAKRKWTFETGLDGFVLTPATGGAARGRAPAAGHQAYSLRFGAPSTKLSQDGIITIDIPAGATEAELSYWWFMTSEKPFAPEVEPDLLYVDVLEANTPQALLERITDRWPRSKWLRQVHDLRRWSGRRVQIRFAYSARSSPETAPMTFWLDDVQFTAMTRQVSIADAVVAEGAGTADFLVTVSPAPVDDEIVTVNYATANGTATAPADYAARSGQLTFDSAHPTRTISVPVVSDATPEKTETFTVALSGASGAVITDATAVGTILNDDGPTISIDDVTLIEGTGVTPTAVLHLRLSAPSAQTVTVGYFTANGTATAPADYTAQRSTVTFLPNVVGKTIAIPVIGDSLDEPDETFTVELTAPAYGVLGKSTGTVTIQDNDVAGSVQFSSPTYTVSEGVTAVTIKVTRTGGVASGATVVYATSDGTARAGSDYISKTGKLTFAAGVASQTFTITLKPDTIVEGPETVILTLSAPGGGATLGSTTSATLTITDNDVGGVLQFSSSTYMVGEATPSATVTVTRTGGVASGVTVVYSTSDGSAQAPGDYTSRTGTLTFGAGVLSRTFAVPIVNDLDAEGPEAVQLTLSDPRGGATLGARSMATLTITDNEPTVKLSATTYTVSEAATKVTITAVRVGSTTPFTVNYATSGDTALAGSDFTDASGTLTFAAGVMTKAFTVPITLDGVIEPNESFFVSLPSATGASLGTPSRARVTITEASPVVQFSAAAYTVSEAAGAATMTVTRTGTTTVPVSVNYATSDGTAVAGSDYTAVGGPLSLAAGVVSRTFAVPITNDTVGEPSETVALTLSSPTGAALGARSTATLTITDNEPVVQLSAAAYSAAESATAATITVTRTGTAAMAVDYYTAPLTATEDVDYRPVSSTLTFASGQVSRTFSVPIIGDTTDEPDETLQIGLRNANGALIGPRSTAVLTIVDNDSRLTLNKTGAGDGTVTSTPAGIECRPGCRTAFGDYTTNTTVRLEAAEDGDSKFLGWTGGCTTTASWCDVPLSQSKTVTANFAATYKLLVNKEGTGTGTVTSTPSGINCGVSCLSASASFVAGRTVTLEAEEATGSTFTQWGGACSGTSCQVLMDAAKTVTATFTGPLVSYTLTVNKSGAGSGTVTSTPAGLTCGPSATSCQKSFAAGTDVELGAQEEPGSVFSKWSGACTSTPCRVKMTGNRTVTATFDLVLGWASGGPDGGYVYDVKVDPTNPSVMYAATFGGLYKSVDGGATWAYLRTGQRNAHYETVAIDPTNSATLYSSASGRVFRSVDAGVTWTNAWLDPGSSTSHTARVLAIDPAAPATIYAGTNSGVFKSTNAGSTWTLLGNGLPSDASTSALVIASSNPAALYVGTSDGVFKSTDSGNTWALSSDGIPSGTSVSALVIDSANPAAVYAGTSSGVFKSTNAGGTWVASNTGLGFIRLSVEALAMDPTNTAGLYVVIADGVFRSSDSASTWTAAGSVGLTSWTVQALALDPANPATLYAGTSVNAGIYAGIYKSTDSGATWSPWNVGLTGVDVVALAVAPGNRNVLFAGTANAGLFKSTNAGGSWAAANTGLTDRGIETLAVDPTNDAILYAGTGKGVFKSTDSGATWVAANTGLPVPYSGGTIWALTINPSDTHTVYAATNWNGVYKTADSGATWANAGLDGLSVRSLAIDPAVPTTLYAGTPDGQIYKSTDSAGTWALVYQDPSPLPFINDVVIDPVDPATVYAGASRAVVKSSDGGVTWALSNTGLGTAGAKDLLIDPTNRTTLYAATYNSGLFRSTNSGATWSPLNLGLPDCGAQALATGAPANPTLYVGLVYGSVWQTSLPSGP